MSAHIIRIDDRVYLRNSKVDRFQVPFDELGSLRAIDVPVASHIEIMGLSKSTIENFELYAVNGGKEGSDESISVYGGGSVPCGSEKDAQRILGRLQRIFPKLPGRSSRPNPEIEIDGTKVRVFYSLEFDGKGQTVLKEAIAPIAAALKRLESPDVHLFMCHASEDKAKAHALATALRTLGAAVWLDAWEIRVGDSIVQKIDSALSSVTHLALLLSRNSCQKPWVLREFSAALMRQLSDRSVSVLPVLLEDCTIPAILADIHYADCRESLADGVAQLEEALFPTSPQLPMTSRGAVEPPRASPTDRAREVEQRLAFERQQRDFENSVQGVQAAVAAFAQLRSEITALAGNIARSSPGLGNIKAGAKREFFLLYGLGPCATLHWWCYHANSLSDSALTFELYDRIPRDLSAIRAAPKDERLLQQAKLQYRLLSPRVERWISPDWSGKTFTSLELAAEILNRYLDAA